MSTHTVESIMGLVGRYAAFCDLSQPPDKQAEAQSILESALTQLVAERDAAIEEANDERKENQTHCACELHEVKGDDGITRMKASVTCYFHTLIERDRDALRSQLAEAREWTEELEDVVRCVPMQFDGTYETRTYFCVLCDVSNEESSNQPIDGFRERFPHTPTCLVRRIEDKRKEKSK